RVRVEYYVNENTLKERLHLYFVKNQRSSLRIRIFNLLIKLLTCVLYIIRVILDDDPISANCYGCGSADNAIFKASQNKTDEQFMEYPIINWKAIIWVNRPLPLWVLQVAVSIVSLSEALLLAYLNYKGNIWQILKSFYFMLEIVNTIPFVLTICYPPLRNLFLPAFLNCWLAKHALENMFNDLHRAMQRSQSALSQQLMILSATFMCLVFTSVCGIQHFQRAGHRDLNLFQAVYYVIVTFSTVGYGDYVPDIWPSQLFMVIMICVALIVLPTQFEQLAFTWMERKKLGGSYSAHRAQSEKHVVVCSTNLQADAIMDFLNEFYAHPHLQDGDLTRARMSEAEACFILAARHYADKTAADEHTILRSWAVKDFAPSIPQYVQIFRPENKLHVKFAEHVVCEDEFKYALLANNCMSPGISTLVTLLLHTSRGQEGQASQEAWHRLYGKCSGNEIYHINLKDSRFFGEYEGKSFTYASFHSHRKFGVALVGVRPAELPEFYEDTILLNPGPRHIMRKTDVCFYMSITKEENSAFVVGNTNSQNPTASTMADGRRISNTGMESTAYVSNTKSTEQQLGGDEAASGEEKTTGDRRGEEDVEKGLIAEECEERARATTRSVSVNELQRKLEEEVEKRREEWEAGQGRGVLREEALIRDRTELLKKDPQRHKLERADTTKSESPSLGTAHFLDVPRSDTAGTLLDYKRSACKNLAGHGGGGSDEASGESDDELDDEVPWRSPSEKTSIVKGFPPVSPYIGVSPTLCYLLKEKKPFCCLQLAQVCEHCSYRSAKEYNWQNRAVILAADYASNGIYNFIIPLRAHFRSKSSLNPIILLLESRPDPAFQDAISWFPLIYWMFGSISCLDHLLQAGINLAENVVVVNKELNNSAEEDTLSDCNTIVAVQTMFKWAFYLHFFPTRLECLRRDSAIAALEDAQEKSESVDAERVNRRQIRVYGVNGTTRTRKKSLYRSSFHRKNTVRKPVYYSEVISQLERREKERGSHISYMFRLPFAAGSVFSASMLDTLLYQAFVKDYLITFVRLLLGIDQAPGSGFLTSMKITKQDKWIRTYGRLYQKLCSTTCEIPMGIFRTIDTSNLEPSNNLASVFPALWKSAETFSNFPFSSLNPEFSLNISDDPKEGHSNQIERAEIAQLVRSRMTSLALPPESYDDVSEKRNSLSFVIINPSCDLNLEEGDIVYCIFVASFSNAALGHLMFNRIFERHNSRRKSNISLAETRRRSTTFSRPPPLHTAPKSTSLSLPDSPQISPGYLRGRSNSLRVDDILMRRSNSLRFGLEATRRINSFEELGISPSGGVCGGGPLGNGERRSSIKIPANGSIGLEVTPPEESGSDASVPSIQLHGTIV
ncbi:potassium channel subfamily T member 2, partial [Hyalella azteca]|uniref:Potassium channel subfamily T member 2 n=1 Tax=Hyalella azteca TaxID=294128 RepID=A0A979FX68_HYAAZ